MAKHELTKVRRALLLLLPRVPHFEGISLHPQALRFLSLFPPSHLPVFHDLRRRRLQRFVTTSNGDNDTVLLTRIHPSFNSVPPSHFRLYLDNGTASSSAASPRTATP